MIWASAMTAISEWRSARRPLLNNSGRGRLEEFYQIVDYSASIPEEDSEMGNIGALGLIAVAFLIGKERESYAAVKPLAKGRGIGMFRRSRMTQVPWELREVRTQTVSTIIGLAIYFAGAVKNDYTAGLLFLLSSFAVDSNTEEMGRRILLVIADAARDEETWDLVQEVAPALSEFVRQLWDGVPLEHLRPRE